MSSPMTPRTNGFAENDGITMSGPKCLRFSQSVSDLVGRFTGSLCVRATTRRGKIIFGSVYTRMRP